MFPTDNYYNYYNSCLPLILVCEVRPYLTNQITFLEVFQSKKKNRKTKRDSEYALFLRFLQLSKK